MCLVLAIPKGNFMENKGDSRAAQITHEEREGEKQCCSGGFVTLTEENYDGIIDLQHKMDGT